jgi:hypothetical protein
MKPWFAALFTLPFAGAYTLGAFGSQDPLVRLACRLAIVIFVLAALLSFWMTAARLRIVAFSIAGLMLASFASLIVSTLVLGGGALNGRVDQDAYYLRMHGRETRVSKWTYYSVATLETLVFASWPAGALLGFRARLLRKIK